MTQDVDRKQAFIEDRMIEGEELIEMADISSYIYWQSIAVGIITLLFFMFVAPQLGYLLAVVTIIMALHAAARREVYLLALTNKRIMVRYGLLQMDVVDLHFDKLESIELEQMLTGILMGYHRISVLGTGRRYISIPYVANGRVIRRRYNEMVLRDK